ncbi:helix-turn-helix domain-containing protein [Chryseobacterium taihuense]|uniref:DNA-binding transcriptional regulator, XRE-family HTH domain n=1 Tax=Chryseobacterium taihuense TaxID=1141221 RepID=A0ABY0QS01_9FLAO|nr:helix-turn-helix transcriptional regulator [Chryseobacterium taihuense]SDL68089.1 DNA-binding transcriptional regulator, XRE-family HTH domain [Chryseobacterium taihuense]
MNTTIGKRIRTFRENKGFSQEELAEKLHISRSTYQRIENGETNSWINHIENICHSLEVNLDDILKPEEGYVQVNNNNESTNDNGSGVIQNQTINYHNSDRLIENLYDTIASLKEENRLLKEEINLLKSK